MNADQEFYLRTLRDRFAGQAMQSYFGRMLTDCINSGAPSAPVIASKHLAKVAYAMADAMLEERAKS